MSATTRKTVSECRISFTADHSQYWQGHGIACTEYNACATGAASTLAESLEDALDQLAQQDIELSAAQVAELRSELRSQLKPEYDLDTDIVAAYCDDLGNHTKSCETCEGTGTVYANPEEDDLTSSDHINWYQSGKLVLTIPEDVDDYKAALQTFMDSQEFWPNCWFISDHGNAINVFSETGNVENPCEDCDGTGTLEDDNPDCAVCAGEWYFYVSVDVKLASATQ